MIQITMSSICKYIGHNWRYKDYTNWIKKDGEIYDFKASRHCQRCEQHEYLFQEWKKNETKSELDVEYDSESSRYHSPTDSKN